MMNRLFKFLTPLWLWLLPLAAGAQFGLIETAEKAGLRVTGVEPEVIVGNIIRGLLGFLGLVAFILVIYAGFLWMTAAGKEEQVTKAKDILRGAVIGLIIIFSSFAITTFVVNQITERTLK